MVTVSLFEKMEVREKKRTTSMAFAWVEQTTWRVNMTTFNLNKIANLNHDYSTIESRIKAFRLDHSSGQIITEIVKDNESNGEVILKAHVVIDGVTKATSHAMETKGISNISKISHLEYAETKAICRVLGMLGYLSDNHLESKDELENAKLQRVEHIKNRKILEADIARLSIKYKKAIDDKNDEVIDECREEIYDNPNLWKAVRDSLSKKQRDYVFRLNEKEIDERKIKKEIREARIRKAANESLKKNLNG